MEKDTGESLVDNKKQPRAILGLSVKKETTLANTLAIFYVAFMDFAPAGFYNAQMTFLLESPDHFNIPRE